MQFWIPLSLSGHFLNAVAGILDKHIVSNTNLKPTLYAFYSGIFQILYILAIPIIAYLFPQVSFEFPSWQLLFLNIFDGALFILALLFLYKAIEKGEVSRINPIAGTSVPIFTVVLSFLFLGQYLDLHQTIAFIFFVIGGFLISANFQNGKIHHTKGLYLAIFAGLVFATYYVIMSFLYTKMNFWSVFIILQFGSFVGSIALLIPTKTRNTILKAIKDKNLEKITPERKTSFFFVFDKVIAAIAAILINYSISIGNVAIINSLQATQYVFILGLTFAISIKKPDILNEEISRKTMCQKMLAIVLISIGLFLIK